MTGRYRPSSSFLRTLIDADEPLAMGDDGGLNLGRLIDLTNDQDPANRDWATLLLSQQDVDTPEVRAALLRAATDENQYVRAEAILGLSTRDKGLAVPLIQRELSGHSVALGIFEAASIVADPSLVWNLSAFAEASGNDFLDDMALEALHACQAAERQDT